jgi:hypothetical protein
LAVFSPVVFFSDPDGTAGPCYLALALGACFEIAGFVGLFDPTNPQPSITIILILREV